MKRCSKCKESKDLSEFYKNKSTKDGFQVYCKPCRKKSDRESYVKNREETCKKQQARYAKNAERERESAKERYRKRMSDPEERRKILDLKAKWIRNKSATDVSFRINRAFSREVCRMINKSGSSWLSAVDYSVTDLMSHLERQFTKKMTWDNYGKYWHIDHIIPKSSFSVSKLGDDEFRVCWSLANLRPLPAIENLKKHSKVETLL